MEEEGGRMKKEEAEDSGGGNSVTDEPKEPGMSDIPELSQAPMLCSTCLNKEFQ